MIQLKTYWFGRLLHDQSEAQSGDPDGPEGPMDPEIAVFAPLVWFAKMGHERSQMVVCHELCHQHDTLTKNEAEMKQGGHHPAEHGCIRVPRCWSDCKTWTHTPISKTIVMRFLKEGKIDEAIIKALPQV